MPKELIHFKTAEMTAARLADTRFAPGLEAHPQAVLIGAVLHDAMFYGATPRALPMARMGHRIHGAKGEDTYTLLRLQARRAAQAPNRDLAAALLVGMTSHLWADTVMHPMVWHLTGDYYADSRREKSLARQRHRALESLMDMTVCAEMIGRPMYRIRNQLASLGASLYEALPLEGMAELAGIRPEKAGPGLASAFKVFAGFQGLFPNRRLSSALYTASPWLPNTAREIVALFYAPQWLDQADHVKGPIRYHNPVSNEEREASLAELMDRAADKAERLCRRLEPAVFDGAGQILPEVGPSLDSGKRGSSTREMRHMAEHFFPTLP
ncbi:zinc dependent phospholipase C family protein [uncultured Pseudodesulfovibrio sp.]|uniref:zinc dependent phospholipase C family protein n=1 Tax=uncultured Pseudodesulfovibrio sp. TaxID=2035858 RepID=UPI0029C9A5E5|nr:zinc dependent phospholipase C family protein [uncultured Pseudodesulfovibrio sp.]